MHHRSGHAQPVTGYTATGRLDRRTSVAILSLACLLLLNAISVASGPAENVPAIVVAVFAAALVSSVAGFAFSAICGALLAPFVDHPVEAVQIMLVCSAAGQSYMVWCLRRDIDWRALVPFLLGAIPGLPLGLFLLLNADPRVYARALGVLLIVYAVAMVTRRPVTLRVQHPALDGFAGFLGGITGGIAAFPGAPVTIWCGLKGWSKERQRGLFQPFILVLQLAALALLASGLVPAPNPAEVGVAAFVGLPAMLLGTMLGLTLFRRLSDRQFSKVLNLFLVASGIALVL